MNTVKTTLRSVVLGLCAATTAAPCMAIELYQWTDEEGVIHFSQWAPAEAVEGVEIVSVEGGGETDNGLGISEADDPEGYQAHRESMDALWADMEASREEERQRQRNAPSREVVYYPSEPSYGYPYVFPGYGLRPPLRPERPPNLPKPTPLPETLPYKRP